MSMRRPHRRILFWALVGGVLTVALVPIAWLAYLSIAPPDALTNLPPRPVAPDLRSYATILEDTPFIRYLGNSLFAAVFSTLVALFIGFPAAYSFSRFRFRGDGFTSILVLFLHAVPPISMVLPFFIIFSNLGLIDTLLGLGLSHVLITLPLAIWLLRGFVARVPHDLEDAAFVDGCGHLKMMWRVLLPVLAPGIAATAVLTFLYSWNDFLFALVLTGTEARTLPVLLTGFITDRVIYWDQLASAGVLVLLPPVIFGLAVQRYLVTGFTAGAVKGG